MAEKFIVSKYDPVDYWNTRTQPNTQKNPGVSPAHIAFFERNVQPGARLLEVGPGVGRLFQIYKNVANKHFDTLDIAEQHRATVENAASEHGLTVTQHFMNEVNATYPFADNSFDWAVSSFVLIHVPFEHIRSTMTELARVAERTIVFTSNQKTAPSTPAEVKPSTHVFSHNYLSLCDELGLKVYDREIFPTNNPEVTPLGFVFGRA